MYPFVAALREMLNARRAAPLAPGEIHETRLRIWPWDLDLARELNNGRSLTLMDTGRLPALYRSGLFRKVYGAGMFMTMAGATVRWRRRIVLWDRVVVRTRITGWDARFFYIEQAILKGGETAVHAVYRVATTRGRGLVAAAEIAALNGWGDSPALPGWIAEWSETENRRPWPPDIETAATGVR